VTVSYPVSSSRALPMEPVAEACPAACAPGTWTLRGHFLPRGTAHITVSRRTAQGHDSTMRTSLRGAIVLVVLAIACTGDESVSRTSSLTTTPTPVGTASPQAPGQLVLAVSRRCCYTEGSFFFLKVSTDAGELILERMYGAADDEFAVRKSLPPGTYSILSYERPCAGSCPEAGHVEALDPPTSRCERVLTIEPSETYHLPVVAGPGVNECPFVLS